MGWLTKIRKGSGTQKKVEFVAPREEKKEYRAVKIKPGRVTCDAVAEISASMYLCNEAPLLPLTNCSRNDNCKCRYEHFSDRRQFLRRESDIGFPHKLVDNERRARIERRNSEFSV